MAEECGADKGVGQPFHEHSVTLSLFLQTVNSLWQKNVELTKEWGNLFMNILVQKKDIAVSTISKGV